MNSYIDMVVVVFMEATRLLITQRYCNIFLGKIISKKICFFSFLSSYILTTAAYLFFHTVLINLLVTFAGLFIISLAYQCHIHRKILFSVMILAISAALDLIAAFLMAEKLTGNHYELVSSFISVFSFFISELVLERVFEKKKQDEMLTKQWWYLLLILFCSICTLYVLAEDRVASRKSVLFIGITLLFLNFIVYYLYHMMIDKYISERENIVLREQMQVYEKQLQLNIQSEKEIRSMKHDLKHHLKEILNLAKCNQYQEIEDYISQMNEYLNYSGKAVDSGNNSIDGILNYMLLQAKEEGISAEAHVTVPETIELSAFDMNIILGNLLENAREAAIRAKQPKITVDIIYKQGCLFITVSNSYDGRIREVNGRMISLKGDSKNHGIGLENISRIVDKYNGELKIKYDEKYFVVNIILFIPAKFAV